MNDSASIVKKEKSAALELLVLAGFEMNCFDANHSFFRRGVQKMTRAINDSVPWQF